MVISLFHGLLLTVPSRLETKRVSESSAAKRQMYLVAQSVRLFATLWTVACQTPSPWDFSVIFFSFPSPGDLPVQMMEATSPVSPALQANSLPTAPLVVVHSVVSNSL